MDVLIQTQIEECDLMTRAFINLKKKGSNPSRGTVETRMEMLEKRWGDIVRRHEQILALRTPAQEKQDYFRGGFITEAEEVFLDEKSKFLDALYVLESSRQLALKSGERTETTVERRTGRRKLPPIDLPQFTGKYAEWTSFKDYFTTLIADDVDLSDVERLHYLKSSVSGEAANLIKNIPVTADNYERAWNKLISYYDNTRTHINACLDALFQVESMQSESAQALKQLRNATSEAIETLQVLGRPVEHMDDILVYITARRFDSLTRRDWELSLGDSSTPVTWKELDQFMTKRIHALERAERAKLPASSDTSRQSKKPPLLGSKSSSNPVRVTAHMISRPIPSRCSFCQSNHYIAFCDKFRGHALDYRRKFASEKRLCFNCLGPHPLRECRSSKTCAICHGHHHTLLHRDQSDACSSSSQSPSPAPAAASRSSPNASSQPQERPVNTHAVSAGSYQSRSLLLATARLIVSGEHQHSSMARALIDPCSEVSFIRESLAQRLKLPRQSVFVPLTGVAAAPCSTAKTQANVIISPRFDDTRVWNFKALILPRLTNYLPSPQRIKSDSLSFLDGLRLADPHLDSSDPIEMIIGADVYPRLIEEGLRKTEDEEVVAQATGLGWILTGSSPERPGMALTSTPSPSVTSQQCIVDQTLSTLLERFWVQEEVPPAHSSRLSVDEEECENHFISTHKRNSDGRYVLRLPFKSNINRLGDSTPLAHFMLSRMEKRFHDQPRLRQAYMNFMSDYAALGHMKEILPGGDAFPPPNSFYLPHHGVFKMTGGESKLRVVFNGSVQLRHGFPINDCLHTGPKLQADILDVLLSWRMHRYVFSADIEKMFRQILIDPDDQRFQQILWRASDDQSISAFRLCTVTYGLTSSPYQAIRTLHQLAKDEADRFPRAAQLLFNNIYVDDILAGADTLDEAAEVKAQLIDLLKAGGFPLSKWTANHSQLLSDVPSNHLAAPQHHTWQHANSYQMLGISWRPADDAFCFLYNPLSSTEKVTKRKALSLIAQLYDPLGWIVPVTISFKIFMQTLWHTGLRWDDTLPLDLQNRWNSLFHQLPDLRSLSVPRWTRFFADLELVELHGFADASERAYAACLYLRTVDASGNVSSTLLLSKSKVAPLKQVSLPRLELCGALLLARLTNRIRKTLLLKDIICHLWSDSTVTLSWIRGHPTSWKTYVANRVSEIQTTLPHACWHHVSGRENPADLASRGIPPRALLESPLWFHGPSFLISSASRWSTESNYSIREDCPEKRSAACLIVKISIAEPDLLKRYSSLNKLLRVTARCQEFIQRLRRTEKSPAAGQSGESQALSAEQLEDTLKFWIYQIQILHFRDEYECLSKNQSVSSKSSLLRLNPFLDDRGLLRLGGRLRHSLLPPDGRNPMILPRQSYLTQLLVWEAHQKTLHGGTQLTLSYLRQRFWIVRGRQLVKSTVFKCLRCWRHRAAPTTQLMGDLPNERVRQHRAFLHTGVDYAGPINLRLSKGRGTRSYKGYIAVFVCLSTRAVHLEAASGYATEDFLNVYRRFVARRGICARLYSDCGTNFVGADKDLHGFLEQAKAQGPEIARLLANDGTEWHFNPPSAPHFGGIWEAAVKSVKFHLKRVLGETLLTFEEMTTLLTQIEACLNSRPLQPLSDDPTDLSALTPGHFLIGMPTLTVPETSLLDLGTPRLSRWQLLRQMYEHFWTRWSSEYLHELQQRPKWRRPLPQPKVGDLCLVRSNIQPPCKWPLARIIRVQPGADGLVRVVQVKTATTTFLRPITKISRLPTEREDDHSPGFGEGGRDVPDL